MLFVTADILKETSETPHFKAYGHQFEWYQIDFSVLDVTWTAG